MPLVLKLTMAPPIVQAVGLQVTQPSRAVYLPRDAVGLVEEGTDCGAVVRLRDQPGSFVKVVEPAGGIAVIMAAPDSPHIAEYRGPGPTPGTHRWHGEVVQTQQEGQDMLAVFGISRKAEPEA